MPYTVTTTWPDERTGPSGEHVEVVAREATATLDAARIAAHVACQPPDGSFVAINVVLSIDALTAAGGTIDADGVSVTVTPVEWRDLAREAGVPEEARHVEGNWPAGHLDWHRRTVLNAYNAPEGEGP